MKTKLLCILALLPIVSAFAQDTAKSKTPFEGMDLSWINGQNRQSDFPLVVVNKKNNETILTGVAYLDAYYNYNFANPTDNTQTISSAIGRHNEFTINLASIGIETNYKNTIGRLWLQMGQMASIVQDLDGSVGRGRNTSVSNLKYIREAAAGYHFNKMHGINLEMGIFMSYIGLESYMLQENWCYQRSMVCDFTPFYFSGARLQLFPGKKMRNEIWLMNGWQTYNSYSNSPSIGSSNYWRPSENIQLVANFYLGKDTYNPDTLGNQSKRIRFHHDNSIVARYYTNKKSNRISSAAFSINSHYGFQKGTEQHDTITSKEHYMYGIAIANRIWFKQNKFAFTLRADYVANAGGYLAFTPSIATPNAYTIAFDKNPYRAIKILQTTATFDIMPNDFITFRIEYGHRESNIPYFTSSTGTTSPSGWINGPATSNSWTPKLLTKEDRITAAISFRL